MYSVFDIANWFLQKGEPIGHVKFGEVRSVIIDNEPYFVGKDVAEILGYTNTKDALVSHVDTEDKTIIQRSENATFVLQCKSHYEDK